MVQKKKWSASVKFEVAMLAIKGEVTLAEIYKRYSVAPSLVHKWKQQLLEQGSQLFAKSDKTVATIAADNERLQGQLYEKIGQLTVERDFLKKSWNRFQGNSGDN
jgi:transposase